MCFPIWKFISASLKRTIFVRANDWRSMGHAFRPICHDWSLDWSTCIIVDITINFQSYVMFKMFPLFPYLFFSFSLSLSIIYYLSFFRSSSCFLFIFILSRYVGNIKKSFFSFRSHTRPNVVAHVPTSYDL